MLYVYSSIQAFLVETCGLLGRTESQRRRGPVNVCIQDVYLAGLLPEVYIYMSEHPHLCTDMLD